MKIAFLDPNNNSPYYNFSLLTALQNTGYEISFFTSRFTLDSDPQFHALKSTNYFFFRISTKISAKYPGSKRYAAFRLLKGVEFITDLVRLFIFLVRNDYALVHVHWPVIPFVMSWFVTLLTINGIKSIYTVNNIYRKDNDNGENVENIYVKRILRRCEKVILFSNKNKIELLNRVDIAEDKVEIVAHGNYDIFRIARELDKTTARKIIGLQDERKVILFFGRMEPYKGIQYLLRALSIVKEKDERIYLVSAGSVGKKLNMNEMVRKYKLEDYVLLETRYIPFKRVENFFVSCDIVVMPYITCTHSGIHYMAYSFGKPVIATGCGELAETIEDGKSGFLVPPGDEYALSECILNYFGLNETERSKMSNYCLKIAEEKYSWQPIAEKLIGIYGRCMDH